LKRKKKKKSKQLGRRKKKNTLFKTKPSSHAHNGPGHAPSEKKKINKKSRQIALLITTTQKNEQKSPQKLYSVSYTTIGVLISKNAIKSDWKLI